MNELAEQDKAARLEFLRSLQRIEELEQRLRDAEAALLRSSRAEAELRDSTAFALGMALVRAAKAPLRAHREIGGMLRTIAVARNRKRANTDTLPEAVPVAQVPSPAGNPHEQSVVPLEPARDAPGALADLRIAGILDQFSHESFSPDCHVLALHPEEWQAQLREFRPHLLLVESAWLGRVGSWKGLVSPCSESLRALVASCRAAGIPTAFWNKEDPLHFEVFIDAAKLFDCVFTTDAACIPRYRRELGHRRVHCLPFALQPAMFSPVSERPREAAFFFAGAYYSHLAERSRDFRRVADAIRAAGCLRIFDRNHGATDPARTYPEAYRPLVEGGVPYAEIPALYRRFAFGVNLNTVKQSPTMFARRVFELIGSGCAVYGNFSVGVRAFLGDLTVSSDDQDALFHAAWQDSHARDGAWSDRRANALRKVLREHTTARRLAYLCEKSLGRSPALKAPPRFVVVSRVGSASELDSVLSSFHRQRGVDVRLALAMPDGMAAGLPAGVFRLADGDLAAGPGSLWGGLWIAAFHPDDVYGTHYLQDIALATDYSQARVIGKGAFAGADGRVRNPDLEYRDVEGLALRRAAFRCEAWRCDIGALLDALASGELREERACSIDAGSYIENGTSLRQPWQERPIDPGVAIDDLLGQAERIPDLPALAGSDFMSGADLAVAFNSGELAPSTSAVARRHRLEVCSIRAPGTPAVLRTAPLPRGRFERDGELCLHLDAHPASEVRWSVEALDASGQVRSLMDLPPQVSIRSSLPASAVHLRLVATLDGPLVTHVDGLHLGSRDSTPLLLCGSGRLLVVTNGYPSREHPYRNAFVHRRVSRYRRLGVRVDVAVVETGSASRSYEFDGVTVTRCDPGVLAATLRATRYEALAVHFLDRAIWSAVAGAAKRTPCVVWVHGAEIQPWTRRAFNYATEAELAAAKAASAARIAFWREALANLPARMSLAFVSSTFASQCWQDLGVRMAEDRWTVLHNPIDTDLFPHLRKDPAQRFRILSIRPHASPIYANDLVAQAIERLAKHPRFGRMQFTLVGDGPLWDANFDRLKAYSNVDLQRRFLHQAEIPPLHRTHGIFLVPTRGDTQGVSRDEAMASGLVPVTCAVGSVPEFVDDASGILCAPEDAEGLAQAIAALVDDPDRFLRLSEAAASRVRRQSAADDVIARELELLGLRRDPSDEGWTQRVQ